MREQMQLSAGRESLFNSNLPVPQSRTMTVIHTRNTITAGDTERCRSSDDKSLPRQPFRGQIIKMKCAQVPAGRGKHQRDGKAVNCAVRARRADARSSKQRGNQKQVQESLGGNG